jgi:prophage antirepressor-like protein
MNEIMTIQGVECYEKDGVAYLKLEAVARGLGFTEIKDGKEYVMWRRVDGYLEKFGFGTSAERPDFIPENIFYRLAMKAKNCAAEEFQAKIADEIIPAIRKTGGYMTPAATAQLAAAVREAVAGELREIKDRVTALEDAVTAPFAFPVSALPSPPPKDAEPAAQPPGRDYMKRWMRTASDKLNLMSSKFSMSNNAILSQLYRFLEKEFGVVLADERIRIMEEYNLDDCSTLKAIFYDEDFRDYLEGAIDYNLAPENRGW